MSETNSKNQRNNRVLPHKHCKICHETISVKSEPRICKKQECADKNAKNESNQKQMRILMLVFFAIFALPFIASIVLQLV